MKQTDKEIDNLIEKATTDIRSEKVPEGVISQAVEKTWIRLSQDSAAAPAVSAPIDRIKGCVDYQALIPAYLDGSLSPARTLLLEDHSHECVPCRKALREARLGIDRKAVPAHIQAFRKPTLGTQVLRWGIAAVILIAVGAVAYIWSQRIGTMQGSQPVLVRPFDGIMFQVSDAGTIPLKSGDTVSAGNLIRAGNSPGGSLQLVDGSIVEMNSRAELAVTDSNDGITIRLIRGGIIVQAAKQGPKHLYVRTEDCLVSVTGTIFSVNSGTKGSRVSVVEGEVHVDHGDKTDVLKPGDQVATSPSLDPVAINQEIAWSRDADRYNKMLSEIAALREEVNQKVQMPEVRYSSRILDLVPAETVVYVAVPNVSTTLAEANRIIEERLRQNSALREWWDSEKSTGKNPEELGKVFAKMKELGSYIGDEVVLTVQLDNQGGPTGVAFLASLNDPAGFRTHADREIVNAGAGANIQFINDPESLSAGSVTDRKHNVLYAWINNDMLVASPTPDSLKAIAASMKATGVNRFISTSFHSQIASLYREGAGLIVAADLERILPGVIKGNTDKGAAKQADAAQQLGLMNLRHLILDIKWVDSKPRTRAVLSFTEAQRGLPSWLASPGPMSALGFISPDATVAAAFVVKDPKSFVDDLTGALDTIQPGFRSQLESFRNETGLDIRSDFAGPLGGEFAFAIDGPVLPSPSWKIVIEVYDQARLQQTLEQLVVEMNKWAAASGKPGLELGRTESGGRVFYTLTSAGLGMEINYTYANGYLIAAPSKALLERALRYHSSGTTLLSSAKFKALLPEDGSTNFSALMYQNIGPVFAPIAGLVGGTSAVSDEQKKALGNLAEMKPTLAYAYAYGDRIIFSTSGDAGPFGLDPATLVGVPNSFGLRSIMSKSMRK